MAADTIQLGLFPDEAVRQVPTKAERKVIEAMADKFAFAIGAPMVEYGSGGWASAIPAWLKYQAQLERLVNVRTGEETATDAEACAYLMTAALCAPLGHEWTQIYLYVTTKECRKDGKDVPADITVETLSDYELERLADLKQWIYRQQWKHFRQAVKGVS